MEDVSPEQMDKVNLDNGEGAPPADWQHAFSGLYSKTRLPQLHADVGMNEWKNRNRNRNRKQETKKYSLLEM